MLIPNKFNGYHNGTRQLHFGSGGGGGGPTQTTSTVQNTNIPSYAQPYVESMLGATQKQLFNTQEVGGTAAVAPTYDDQGNQLTAGTAAVPGYTELTGFKPFQAYGGTYDAQGNQLAYDPSKGIAKIDPMQTKAYMGVAGMQTPTQGFADANWAIKQAGLGADQSAQEAYKYGQEGAKSGALGQQLGIAGGAKYGEMGAQYGTQGANLGIAGGQKYGAMGAGYGSQAAGLADTALGYGQDSSDIGRMGLRAEQYGRQVSGQAEDYARQAAGAGAQYARMATDPRVTQALMNPYTQNVLDVQNKELDRSAGIAAQARGAQAVRAGAFGGGRQAIENAEAQRNLEMMKNANQAQALNQAYQQAQAQQQFGANLNLQGLAGAQQGLGTALQGGQLGLSGIGTALQGQQGALAGVGAANQAYQTGIQGAGMGLQGVNTQLAGTAQGMQGAQVGLQGVDRQLAGTAQGMQGAQIGLQGVQGAQAGYNLLGQQGMNLTSALGQQQQQQLGLANAQMGMGDKKMAYDQSILNQAVQDYANAQQYPLMQLGTMSNMLRGLPMQASTTNQYAASPNPLSQAVGTIGAGASIYNAMAPRSAAGGEVKGYAKGGIMSYDMGGEVEEQLESMDEKGLQAQARESTSPSIRKMAQRLLRERQMSKQPQGTGPMGVQYQAAQPQMPSYAPGGIVAFQQGAGGNGVKSAIEEGGEEDARRIDLSGKTMDQRLAMPPTTEGGIMGATTQPATQVPAAPAGPSPDVVKEAMRQRDLASAQANRPTAELLKEIQAERDALGVGENVGRQEFRAQQMAERANLADEKERQRHMRLAEFFASWGSTPGPVLVAGMNALKQSIPGIISDEKEAKKARKEADKIIYDIDEATRLEKLGMIDKATAKKEQAAKHAEDYNKYLLTFQSQRESDKRALEVAGIQAKAQTDAAAMRNSSDKLGRLQAEALRNEDRVFGRYQAATKQYDSIKEFVAKQESSDTHKEDLKKLERYTMGAKDKKTGEINPEKINKEYKNAYAETLKRVEERKEKWNTAVEDARKEKDLAFSRIKNLSPEAVEARTGPKVNPADSGAGTTGNFPTPTAKHIQALKDNPGAKAEFDGKFGPGAADEYLGK